ncbi:MAG: flagellar basal body rod protein FlgC [Acidobacteria bacterium]|nr:MAG: flagellar basal body rod protein FlgC [Acidobacteriota bacterium]
MNLFGVMGISASGLSAQRTRAEVVASNMANAESTHTAEGGPYQRKEVVFQSASPSSFRIQLASSSASAFIGAAGGVTVRSIVADTASPIQRYEPSHPDADANGFVSYPNINPVLEMTDLMDASRAYQMNASAVQAAKQMIQQSIELLK